MAEDKKSIQLSTGNWITIAVFVVGIISAWAKIQVHISDENIHLTESQQNNLIEFTTIVDEKLPTITSNEERITEIERIFYGFDIRFDILYEEHESLEGKVSRNYVELEKKINNESTNFRPGTR